MRLCVNLQPLPLYMCSSCMHTSGRTQRQLQTLYHVTACLEPWSMSSIALRTLCLLVHNQLFPRHNVTPSPKDYGSYRAYVQMPQATLSLSFNAFTRVLQHGSARRALDKCHSFNT